jgi:hypothetical protein
MKKLVTGAAAVLAAPLAFGFISVGSAPQASAAPCANRTAYDLVSCQNCQISVAQNPNVPRDLCYRAAPGASLLPPPQPSTGFPDCDAMPNAQQRIICGDQHLTGQR